MPSAGGDLLAVTESGAREEWILFILLRNFASFGSVPLPIEAILGIKSQRYWLLSRKPRAARHFDETETPWELVLKIADHAPGVNRDLAIAVIGNGGVGVSRNVCFDLPIISR